MNENTGEIKMLTPEEKQAYADQFDGDGNRKRIKIKNQWWIECKVEPTVKQKQSGLKGWHDCLCGSGKKFRECCRVKTPYVRRVKK